MTFQSDFKTPSDFLDSKLHNRLKIPTKIRVKDLKLFTLFAKAPFSPSVFEV